MVASWWTLISTSKASIVQPSSAAVGTACNATSVAARSAAGNRNDASKNYLLQGGTILFMRA